jgi:hypothetical protein
VIAPFLTNARFAETGDVAGPEAGELAAAGEGDGDGAAHKKPLGASTAVDIARAMVNTAPRRNHRHRVLRKDAADIKG